MNHIGGIGRFAPSARWRKVTLTKKGEQALSGLTLEPNTTQMVQAHEDSEGFRDFAERFREKPKKSSESIAQFSLDPETGHVNLTIHDASSGMTELKLTAEQVAEGLKNLEEAEGEEGDLISFFIDLRS